MSLNNTHPSEETTNRVLRRGDWRFLLSDVKPGTSTCFGEGLLRQSVEAFSAHFVDPRQAGEGECDLAAAVNPSPSTLESAWNILKPGGAFYSEWTSIFPGIMHSARKKLEMADFKNLTCYWPWPAPERRNPSFWLPLDAPNALDYFLSTRPRASSTFKTYIRKVLEPVWRVSRKASLLSPLSFVAYKPCVMDNAPGASGIGEEILAYWQNQVNSEIPERLSWMLLTGGARSMNKVVALVFADRESAPKMAVKFARIPDSIAALEREKDTLQAVHALGAGSQARIPQVLFYRQEGSTAALAETPVTGQPLYTGLNQSTYRSLALKVTRWLSCLVHNSIPRSKEECWAASIEPVLYRFEDDFTSVLDSDHLHRNRSLLESMSSLPITSEQRDCSPWNLLITDEGLLGVLDWESATIEGLPLIDLTYFLTYMAFFIDGAMESGMLLQSYLRAHSPETFTGRVQEECQKLYLQETGLTPADLKPLRLLTWMVHSHSEVERMAADTAGQVQPEQLRRSLFFQLWLAELDRKGA